VGLDFIVETSAGNNETGASIRTVTTDVGAGVEDFALAFNVMTGGSTAAEVARVDSAGLFTTSSLNLSSSTAVSSVLDEDAMGSNSATALATQQSIKAYVDAQQDTVDTLAEVMALGNSTGATNLVVTAGSVITTDTVSETTAASGVTVDGLLIKDSGFTLGSLRVTAVLDEDAMTSDSASALPTQQSTKAYVDAQLIAANSLAGALLVGASTDGTDLVVTAGDEITTDTIAETTAASGVTVDGVILKDGGITTSGNIKKSVVTGITAGSTQTQAGATALTGDINNVTIVGTNGDGVQLPTAVAGLRITVINSDAAQSVQVWPATSDTIDGGAADAVDANSLAFGTNVSYESIDGTGWYSMTVGSGDALVANTLAQFAATTSAQLAGVLSDETGSGSAVFATSPTLVTPALGTPSALVLTNATGTLTSPTFVTPALGTPASGVATNLTGTASSLTAGNVTTNANLTGHVTSTGNAAVLGSFTAAQLNTAVSDATLLASGGALGTPSSGTATNITGLPAAGVVGTAAILGANTFTGTQVIPAVKITTGAGADKVLTSDAAGDATWEVLSSATTGKTGDLVTSSRALTTPDWLPCTGLTYLQSSYSALFAELGLVNSFDPMVKLADPAALPGGDGHGGDFSPDGVYMAIAHATTPFVTIYKRAGETFTKLTNPTTLPTGQGTGASFSSDGVYLAVTHRTSPFVTIYKRAGDTFTKLTNPATLPANHAYGVSFSADDGHLTVSHFDSPYVTTYSRSGDTFTKLANPATLPTGRGYGVSYSPSGVYMAVAHDTGPYITIYKRSGDTFTKLANPATLPTGNSEACMFSPDDAYLAVTHTTSPYITIYKRSGDTFTKLANPAALPTNTGAGCAFSADSQYLSVSTNTTPFIVLYKRFGDVFSKIATPTGGGNGGWATFFAPYGTHLVYPHNGTPYVGIYSVEYDSATQFKTPFQEAAEGTATFIKT
jgi:predicted transcriptional regulator